MAAGTATPGNEGRFTLRVPAKVNLFLRVVARRADGYHEVETVLQSIGLYDELEFERASGWELGCDQPGVPLDDSNLVARAAAALRARCGVPLAAGARVTIRKRIPVGAGLGGGSADAAAALVGLARLWGVAAAPETLAEVAAALGSDVPFFLRGGAVLGRGRGERLEPLPAPAEFWLVLVKPPFPVATAWAYRAWQATTSVGPSLDEFLAALAGGDPAAVAAALRNDLEPAVAAAHPAITSLRARLLELGALGARMTGSGSAVFAVTGGEAAARRLAAALGDGYGEGFVVPTLPEGAGSVGISRRA
jgi:4-diphosphocytidyl-2-C-methyl-D-erythritol kinase